MKNSIQFQLSEETIGALRTAAASEGIAPNVLARMILHRHFKKPDAESKAYTFITKKWREFEEYAEAKSLGSVEVFACFAMDRYMGQNALTKGRKQKSDEI
jgi:hypothetical protein